MQRFDSVCVLGGAGLVGYQVCRQLLRDEVTRRVAVVSLRKAEVQRAVAGELLRRHELRFGEHENRLAVHPPGVSLRLFIRRRCLWPPFCARPDRRAVLEHLGGDPGQAAECLDAVRRAAVLNRLVRRDELELNAERRGVGGPRVLPDGHRRPVRPGTGTGTRRSW